MLRSLVGSEMCIRDRSRPSAIRVRKSRSDEGVRGEIGDREQFRVSDSSLEDRRLARPFGLTETCTQSMSKLQCPECRAIYLDLSELMRAERKRAGAFDPTQFREWMQSLSKTDWAELRKSVMGSSGWQRFRKHYEDTGHTIFPETLPPPTPSSN